MKLKIAHFRGLFRKLRDLPLPHQFGKLKIAHFRFGFNSGLFGILAVVFLIGLGVWWTTRHLRAPTSTNADATAAPTAGVAKVTREDLYKEITAPAEFRPYVEAALNAKVSGYVKNMNVDFGDKVKAGELLATLEVPELQDELDSARAAEQKAEADYTNANLIYTRLHWRSTKTIPISWPNKTSTPPRPMT